MFEHWLQRHLREHCGLRNTPLNLLAAIVRLSRNSDGHCWARASYLGQCIARAERTVRATIAALRSLGLIRTRATGRSLICTPAWEKLGLEQASGVPTAHTERSQRHDAHDAHDADEAPIEGPCPDETRDVAPATAPPDEASAEGATRRRDEPTNRPSTPSDEILAQVAARFGDDAARDVAEVLATDRRATTDVVGQALERLLAVSPARLERSAGGYFRRLVALASEARLAPARCRPAVCAAGPVDDEVKTQIARVNALKDQLQQPGLSVEQHRQLTHALHQETEALIQRNAAKNARDKEKVILEVAPSARSPSPPLRPRAGPPPDWLATFMKERVEGTAALAT